MTRIALVVALLLGVTGCNTKDSDSKNASSKDTTVNTVEFKIEKPPAFTGKFNPNDLMVGTRIGDVAPEIVGKDADGIEFRLSDYRGQVVLLDFWGDW